MLPKRLLNWSEGRQRKPFLSGNPQRPRNPLQRGTRKNCRLLTLFQQRPEIDRSLLRIVRGSLALPEIFDAYVQVFSGSRWKMRQEMPIPELHPYCVSGGLNRVPDDSWP